MKYIKQKNLCWHSKGWNFISHESTTHVMICAAEWLTPTEPARGPYMVDQQAHWTEIAASIRNTAHKLHIARAVYRTGCTRADVQNYCVATSWFRRKTSIEVKKARWQVCCPENWGLARKAHSRLWEGRSAVRNGKLLIQVTTQEMIII